MVNKKEEVLSKEENGIFIIPNVFSVSKVNSEHTLKLNESTALLNSKIIKISPMGS